MSKLTLIKENIKSIVNKSKDNFLNENPLDPVDINIIDNYTDFIIESIEIVFDRMGA